MTHSYDEIIREAQRLLRPRRVGDRLVGDVASILVTDTGTTFSGASFDAGAAGLCAERSAIAAMVTAGESRVDRIVAVWQEWEEKRGDLFVLPPCGHCRQLLIDVDARNCETLVVLGRHEAVRLAELLPRSGWPDRPVDFSA